MSGTLLFQLMSRQVYVMKDNMNDGTKMANEERVMEQIAIANTEDFKTN